MSCSEPNGYEDYIFNIQFVNNLPPDEVHRRALSARNLWGKAEKTLISWVIEINDRRLYRDFACSSIYHYAVRYLKLAEHTVAEFLRTGRKLADLPLLSSAYEKGELSSTHIREITRVATPDTEGFWYETAKNCTTRKIEKLVAFTPKGGFPPLMNNEQKVLLRDESTSDKEVLGDMVTLHQESAGETPGNRGTQVNTGAAEVNDPVQCRPAPITVRTSSDREFGMQAKYREKLIVELTAEEMAIMKGAFDKARKECGKKDRALLLVHMARVFIEGSSRKEAGRKTAKAPFQVVYHHHLPSGISWCDTEKGERPISPVALEKALCDAEIKEVDEIPEIPVPCQVGRKDPLRDVKHSRIPSPEQATTEEKTTQSETEQWEVGMEHVKEFYGKMKQAKHRSSPGRTGKSRRARRTIPSALRKKVLERDGHSCQTPGCGRELFTVLHHLDPVALGGSDESHRLITLCWSCHDLVHEGTLSVRGDAPDNLVWGERRNL
jgi:hypothetical protein